MNQYDFTGQTAVVTGGSHGIGLAIATMLAAGGADLVILSRSSERLNAAQSVLVEAGAKSVYTVQMDAVSPDSVISAIAQLDHKVGTCDILINNVGGGGRWGKADFCETDLNVWSEVYQKNAMTAVSFTRWAVPKMRERGFGRVVTISSFHGKEGQGRPWFTSAKAAEIAMMKTMAKNPQDVRCGITFNSVAPGSILIPDTGWEQQKEQDPVAFAKLMDEDYPLGRLGTPEEVAQVVVFLCSPLASLVNGACLVVDGGESNAY